MSKHYQEIVDEIFGRTYKHRTLRTIFDPFSSEWAETDMNKKIEILQIILNSRKISLEQLIEGYKDYYTEELENKRHVITSVEDSLIEILQHLLCKK